MTYTKLLINTGARGFQQVFSYYVRPSQEKSNHINNKIDTEVRGCLWYCLKINKRYRAT